MRFFPREVKPFSDRNPLGIGAIGLGIIAALVLAALQYDKLPFFSQTRNYSAYFAEAGGLTAGAPVQVAGVRVGRVGDIDLDGDRVLVEFDVDKHIRLGDRTEAAVKTKSLLGAKTMEITPRGDGELDGVIPLDRTTPAYQLPDALGDLSATINDLDTDTVSDSLRVVAQTFADTPPDLRVAVEGVARFSETLGNRDAQLRTLLENANKATTVLAERTDQVVTLLQGSNALLAQLRTQSDALDQISNSISAASRQVAGFIADNRAELKPGLDKLNGVLTIVDNRKERVQKAIKSLNAYAMSLGESVAAGPFFKAYVVNLLPGQFIQPFVDAAFSDLGLDPNVLLPSETSDPQTGQPATPALPMPYPRTGQGGAPHLNLPDAITGKPGDPRYPYREPEPAPAPGGPPPGPPAASPPNQASVPAPTPRPVFEPAPNEVPPPPLPAPQEGR